MTRLSLSFLGTWHVTLDEQPVTAFESDKVRALLAYLAVEADRPHRRSALAGLLWPDRPERNARQNLSQALFNLRRAIGDHNATPPFLLISPQAIQFNRASDHWLDVTTFTALVGACETHPHRRLVACAACLNRLEQAAALYRGGFLQGFSLSGCPAFEEWALVEQEHLASQLAQLLQRLVACYEERGDYTAAIAHARCWIELDPWHEQAHQRLMRLLALDGQWEAALTQYETCRRLLTQELGVEPVETTQALYARIKARAVRPPRISGPPSNLPAPLTPFIGREKELAQIRARLDDPACRLLTLIGPGGSGKTRLALEAAAAQRHSFEHGVFFVPLAPLTSGDALVPAVANALDFTFHPSRTPEAQLLDYVRRKNLLLVMDNWEHLLTDPRPPGRDSVEWLIDLLRTAPGVTVLATSRVGLNLQAEQRIPLSGMALPDDDDKAAHSDAVRLFMSGAQRTRPDFELTADNQADVVHICRLVGGLPLGILLAAAWADRLPPDAIATRIAQTLDFLATTWRDLPARQRSLRAAFDHSWRLLTEREQRVFQRLAVFSGSFTAQAAQSVAGISLADLTTLVSKSLLGCTAAGRYQMHEFLRQFALEKLAQSPADSTATRDRHCAYYTTALGEWAAALQGPRQQAALAEIEAEIENARVAWSWAAERRQTERLDRALEGLCRFYAWRVRYPEGEAACRQALEQLASDTSPVARRLSARLLAWCALFGRRSQGDASARQMLAQSLTLLHTLPPSRQETQQAKAFTLWRLGRMAEVTDRQEARRLYAQSLALYRAAGDRWGAANALGALGGVAWNLGDHDAAHRYHQESLELRRALNDHRGIANSLMSLGVTALYQGRLEQAESLVHGGSDLRKTIGDRKGIADGLRNLGIVYIVLGRFAQARDLFEEALAIYTDLGFRYSLEVALLGEAELHMGRYADAQRRGQAALAIGRETGYLRGVGFALRLLGEADLAAGRYAAARRALQESRALFQEIGQQDETSRTLADIALAARGQGQHAAAQGALSDALRLAAQSRAFISLLWIWPTAALLSADQGHGERALELHVAASRYPLVAQSRWFQSLLGRPLAEVEQSLPPETAAAARQRGQGMPLRATLPAGAVKPRPG